MDDLPSVHFFVSWLDMKRNKNSVWAYFDTDLQKYCISSDNCSCIVADHIKNNWSKYQEKYGKQAYVVIEHNKCAVLCSADSREVVIEIYKNKYKKTNLDDVNVSFLGAKGPYWSVLEFIQ